MAASDDETHKNCPLIIKSKKKKIKLIASTCCMRKVENIERFARRRRLFFSSSFYWSMAYKRIIHCHKKSLSVKKNCLWRAKNGTINNVSYANISVFFSFNSFCNCSMKFKFVLCGKRNVVLFLRIDFFLFSFLVSIEFFLTEINFYYLKYDG